MQLSDQAIKEYQEIYFKKHGEHISAGEAQIQGIQLLTLLDKVMQIKEDDFKDNTAK